MIKVLFQWSDNPRTKTSNHVKYISAMINTSEIDPKSYPWANHYRVFGFEAAQATCLFRWLSIPVADLGGDADNEALEVGDGIETLVNDVHGFDPGGFNPHDLHVTEGSVPGHSNSYCRSSSVRRW